MKINTDKKDINNTTSIAIKDDCNFSDYSDEKLEETIDAYNTFKELITGRRTIYSFEIDGNKEETELKVLTGAQIRAYSQYDDHSGEEDLIDIDQDGYHPIADYEFVRVHKRRFIHCPK